MSDIVAAYPYVSAFVDRHGKTRLRFRRDGKSRYFKAPLGTEDFKGEYDFFMGEAPAPTKREPVAPHSVADLCTRYYASTEFGGNADTRARSRAILEKFRAKHGHRPADKCPYEKLDKYISELGQTGSAEKMRKQVKKLFAYAVQLGWRPTNPMQYVRPVKYKKQPFHAWSEAEIAQYQNVHALGTKARLALELYLWTAKRRGDGIRLGPQHVRDGFFFDADAKTSKDAWIPIAPDLAEAIAATAPHPHLVYLPTEYGKPFSKAGFGARFKKWCEEAELPHCSAHGLRKAITRRMAELGINNEGMKAITMHSDDREIAHYAASANQKKLAAQSMKILADAQKCLTDADLVRQQEVKSAYFSGV